MKAYYIGEGSTVHGTDEKGKFLDRKSDSRQTLMEGKRRVKWEWDWIQKDQDRIKWWPLTSG